MTHDELLFFTPIPQLLPLYIALRDALTARYPALEIRVAKSQISFRNRRLFAMASLPRCKWEGVPATHLVVSFGLGVQRCSPRIVASVEAYPNRWTHHVPVADAAQIDAELLAWLDEAYRFSQQK